MTGTENGWAEYSKLVLKELETLAIGMNSLQSQLESVRTELAGMKAKEDKVHDLVQWKQRIDDVASPIQLKELNDAVVELRLFRTKAVTIFMVVQFAMGLALALLKLI
jgi:uncharacterized protein YoxC